MSYLLCGLQINKKLNDLFATCIISSCFLALKKDSFLWLSFFLIRLSSFIHCPLKEFWLLAYHKLIFLNCKYMSTNLKFRNWFILNKKLFIAYNTSL